MERLSNSHEESYFSTQESNNSLFAFSEELDEIFDSFQHFCPIAPLFEYPNESQNIEDDEYNYNLDENFSSLLDEECSTELSTEEECTSSSGEEYQPSSKKFKKYQKFPQHSHCVNELQESQKVSTADTVPTPVLWIGNVGTQVREEDLLCAFRKFGNVVNIRILREKLFLRNFKICADLMKSIRFCGFVTFDNAASASSAKFHLHHKIFGDQAIVINFKRVQFFFRCSARH